MFAGVDIDVEEYGCSNGCILCESIWDTGSFFCCFEYCMYLLVSLGELKDFKA